MDTLTYHTCESQAIPCKSLYPLSKTSAAQYSKDVRPVVTECRKLLCMNVKQPNAIRLLSRQGKYTDTILKVDSIRYLSSTESHPNHPLLFFAVGGKGFAILSPQILATGELSVSVKETAYPEELYAVATADTGRVFVLGQSHLFEADEVTGELQRTISLTPKTAVKYPAFDYHQNANLIVVPAKATHLDLISSWTCKSVLSKAWEPHPDAVPVFAHFFHAHTFPEEKDSDSVFMVTTAQDNSELRFWAFNVKTQRFSLKQEIILADKDFTTTNHPARLEISITPGEEYIILASQQHAFAVVIELHRTLFKVHRMTTWKTQGPALCCAASIGKIAESAKSKSVSYEVLLTFRTHEGFFQAMLDSNKLIGASNTSNAGGVDNNPTANSISNWFGNTADSDAGDKFNEIVNKSGGNAQLTAVSSSLLGESKIANTISEAGAAKLVRQQSAKFREQLLQFDSEFAKAQKKASENLRMLQDSRFREEAQSLGRRFATRNQGRLQRNTSNYTESGVMTEQQQELIQGIENIVREVEGGSAAAASGVLKALLQKNLKSSIEKVSANLDYSDATAPLDANNLCAGAVQLFRAEVEAASSELLTNARRLHGEMKTISEPSPSEAQYAIQNARMFVASVNKGLAELKSEVADFRSSLSKLQCLGRTVIINPDKVVARAVSLAEVGSWVSAVTTVLESDDLFILLRFLGSNVCQENISVLTSPNTLNLPLFVSICLQLAYQLDSEPASIPTRIKMLHHFYVNWDDSLKVMKEQAVKDPRQAKMFEFAKRELATVQTSLMTIDALVLDRKIKNKCRLVKKLIDDFVKN